MAGSEAGEEQDTAVGPEGSTWYWRPILDMKTLVEEAIPLVHLRTQPEVGSGLARGLGEFPLLIAVAAFWATHRTCGQGRAQEMSCLEPTHSASCSLANDGLG